MDIWLYHTRILALEKKHVETRRHLNRLLRQARYHPDSVDQKAFKSQLDLVKALIKLTKEETAFFVKLGQRYDVMKFHTDFIDIIERRDPTLAIEILREIDARWLKSETKTKN